MDYEGMEQRLESFRQLCEAYEALPHNDYTPQHKQLTDKLNVEMPTIKAILGVLDPALPEKVKQPQYIGGVSDSLHAVQQGLGIIRDREALRTMLTPEAPTTSADHLHPRLWGASSTLWSDGHFREALQAAATALSLHIADKSQSSLSDGQLVAAVLAPDAPTSNQPTRLHLPGDTSTPDWRNRQKGLQWLAQGAFSGIRNVSSHTLTVFTEQEALEQLIVLSLVARWIDSTALVKWEP